MEREEGCWCIGWFAMSWDLDWESIYPSWDACGGIDLGGVNIVFFIVLLCFIIPLNLILFLGRCFAASLAG